MILMKQKWNLRYGVIFWITKGKGIIADLITHKQFVCDKETIRFLENGEGKISEQNLMEQYILSLHENVICVVLVATIVQVCRILAN